MKDKVKILKFLIFLSLWNQVPVLLAKSVGRIVGGENANAGQLPFAAAINVQTSDSRFFCCGTILNKNWIITSATCVNNGVLFTINIGSIHLDDSNAIILASSDYVIHENFNEDTLDNDIGVIKLRVPLEYSLYVNRIFLTDAVVDNGDSVVALGWGQTSDSSTALSNRLQYVQLDALSNDRCRIYYGNQLTDNMVCVEGNYNQGSCIGDNGGTLFTSISQVPFLVGIATFVSQNGCESIEPSGYTRVQPYLDWIRNITGG